MGQCFEASCFQSHHGLILTAQMKILPTQLLQFSIPPWSDSNFYLSAYKLYNAAPFQSHHGLILTPLSSKKYRPRFSFSIPPWSDSNYTNTSVHTSYYDFSIPPWSDSNLFRIFLHMTNEAVFNPTMV